MSSDIINNIFRVPTIIIAPNAISIPVLKVTVFIRHTHTCVSNNDLPGIINGKYVPYTHYNIAQCSSRFRLSGYNIK